MEEEQVTEVPPVTMAVFCPHDGTETVLEPNRGGDMVVHACPSCGTHFTEEELKRRLA